MSVLTRCFTFVSDWSKWDQPPSGDDTPKGGWPKPLQSVPPLLRDSPPMRMMSHESGRKLLATLGASDAAARASAAAPAAPSDDTGGP